MATLVTALLLTVVIMTQAAANDVMEDLRLPPISEHMLLLDVTSDASTADVKKSLCGLNVRHSFKVGLGV